MKILMVTKNWVGDILFELPTLDAVRAKYPDAVIACMATERCREILENYPAVDRVILFDERRIQRSIFSKLRFIWQLRKKKWDQAYFFHRSRTRALILFLAGVKQRYGFGGKRKLFLTRDVPEPEPVFHQVDHFLKLLDGVGVPRPATPDYRFYVQEKDQQWAEAWREKEKMHHYVCFHLGANWEPKRWPPAYFAELAEQIHQKWKLPVVVTGAKRDQVLFDEMNRLVKTAKVFPLIGQTSLGQLAAVYTGARFVVSGDSGPLHIASGVGTRVVAIFGPTDPGLTGPRGIGEKIVLRYVPQGFHVPWYGQEFPKEGWLSQIKSSQVMEAIETRGWQEDPGPNYLTSLREEQARKLKMIYTKRQNEKSKSIHHILIVTLSNIGDVILTTPVIATIAAKFPEAQVTVVVGPKGVGVLKGSRLIDRLIVYDKIGTWKQKLRFIERLRLTPYDWVVDLRNTLIPFLVKRKRASSAFRRSRTGLYRERHLDVIRKMGLSFDETPPFDFFNQNEEATFLKKIEALGVVAKQDWIVVSPTAASELKTWPFDGFRQVLERLVRERSEEILLVGDTPEREKMQPLVELAPSRIHNLAGFTTLRELACAVSKCSLLLANDSAAMHLGYEMQKPVVAIFGPTHHEKYGRRGPSFRIIREEVSCAPCEQPVCHQNRQICFEDLHPEKVLRACKELLGEPATQV